MQYLLDADVIIQLVKTDLLAKIKDSKSIFNVIDTTLKQVTDNPNATTYDYEKYIKKISMSSNEVRETIIRSTEKNLGFQDWSLIVYASHHNTQIITTNDKALYKQIKNENLPVIRLLGLLETLYRQGDISKSDLKSGLHLLKNDSSIRIPDQLIGNLLTKI